MSSQVLSISSVASDRSVHSWVATPTSAKFPSNSASCLAYTDLRSEASSRTTEPVIKNAFTFDRNSMINGLVSLDGKPSYSITTNRAGTRTDVSSVSEGRIVATIKRRELLADTIKFRCKDGTGSVPLNKWLRPSASFKRSELCVALTIDSEAHIWKSTDEYRLALFHEGRPNDPLAFIVRSSESSPPLLYLKEQSPFLDDILVSFIILEQRLRMKEKRRENGMLYGPLSDYR